MPLTLGNSNYNGEVLEELKLELTLGNEIAREGISTVLSDVSGKKALPKMSAATLPIGVYTAGAPSAESATVTYAEREIDVQPATVYMEFNPSLWHGTIWKLWESKGDFTNLEINAQLMTAIMGLLKDKIGAHYSALCFQGDKTLAAVTKMHYFDGWITRAIADANVIKPTPAGNITANNFADILAATWSAIPSHLIKDPDFTLKVSTNIWKIFQTANLKLKEAYMGVLGMGLDDDAFLKSKIIPFDSMPDHYILGSKSDNLYNAVWVSPEDESIIIDKILNNSREWFVRMDMKMDANYSIANEVVLYEPA